MALDRDAWLVSVGDAGQIEPFYVQFARLVTLVWLRGHKVQRGQP